MPMETQNLLQVDAWMNKLTDAYYNARNNGSDHQDALIAADDEAQRLMVPNDVVAAWMSVIA